MQSSHARVSIIIDMWEDKKNAIRTRTDKKYI